MYQITIIIYGALSFICVDLNLFKRKNTGPSFQLTSQEMEIGTQKQKIKSKKRLYKNRKYKKRAFYQKKDYSLKGTHAKDSRYSNQKDIRRMHTSYA